MLQPYCVRFERSYENFHEHADNIFRVTLNLYNGTEYIVTDCETQVFHYFFLDEKYDQQYQSDKRFGQVIATFSLLAVLIACLGLFGLSAYTIVQRRKEIGVRKILGATVLQIVNLLSRDFAKVVLIAALIALPLSGLAIEQWLAGYSVRIDLNIWMFILPVIIILFIALLTVSVQTIRTAIENPVNALKQE